MDHVGRYHQIHHVWWLDIQVGRRNAVRSFLESSNQKLYFRIMDILYINDETIRLLILFSYKEQQPLPSIIDGLYLITRIYAGDIKHI